jgi:hypothetical protein
LVQNSGLIRFLNYKKYLKKEAPALPVIKIPEFPDAVMPQCRQAGCTVFHS